MGGECILCILCLCKSLKFELKGYSTRVRSNKEPLFGKKVSNTLKPSKNPSLLVYLVRPSKCQVLASPCKILLKKVACKDLQIPATCLVSTRTLARMDFWAVRVEFLFV
jgi:hypothetical protein